MRQRLTWEHVQNAREGLIALTDLAGNPVDPAQLDEASVGDDFVWRMTEKGREYEARARLGEEPGGPPPAA